MEKISDLVQTEFLLDRIYDTSENPLIQSFMPCEHSALRRPYSIMFSANYQACSHRILEICKLQRIPYFTCVQYHHNSLHMRRFPSARGHEFGQANIRARIWRGGTEFTSGTKGNARFIRDDFCSCTAIFFQYFHQPQRNDRQVQGARQVVQNVHV